MAESVSTYLGIEPEMFATTGAFDAILDVDSKLFIDPHLVKFTSAPELQSSYEIIRNRFANILKLLEVSQRPWDAAWREANRLFVFTEVKGLCIGYSSSSTFGSGMGAGFRRKLLGTAKEIVNAGIKDPEIFELMGLFEEGVGADRISDMTARIILADLLTYSERIFSDLEVKNTVEYKYQDVSYSLPRNPFNNSCIILIPQDILRDLPMAKTFEDIGRVVGYNQKLRQRLNNIIGVTWEEARRVKKSMYKQAVLGQPEILQKLIEEYRDFPPTNYDYLKDPAGQVAWFQAGREYAREYPLELRLAPHPLPEAVFEVVLRICQHFKQNIENNGLHTLLYRDDECVDPKREEAAQKIFLGIADAHCRANNLDLSPETNSGRGAVDFKISQGYLGRVLVETKLTTNSKLVDGFRVQVQEYQKAEQTSFAIYLVIDVTGGSQKKVYELNAVIEKGKNEGQRMPEVLFVYARRKPSASRYRIKVKPQRRRKS